MQPSPQAAFADDGRSPPTIPPQAPPEALFMVFPLSDLNERSLGKAKKKSSKYVITGTVR